MAQSAEYSLCDTTMSPFSERDYNPHPITRLPPEILINIFTSLGSENDLINCVLVCRTWFTCAVHLLWHRPLLNTRRQLASVVTSIGNPQSYYSYSELIRCLDFTSLTAEVSDETVKAFQSCKKIGWLALVGCRKLTDQGVLSLVEGNKSLLGLGMSDLDYVTDHALRAVARNCSRLQSLRIAKCFRVTDESLVALAMSCRCLERVWKSSGTMKDQC